MEDHDRISGFYDSVESRRFAQLVASMLDTGELDDEASSQLETLLRQDDGALQKYVELVDVDAQLRWAFRGGIGPQPTLNGKATALNGAAGQNGSLLAGRQTPRSSPPRSMS